MALIAVSGSRFIHASQENVIKKNGLINILLDISRRISYLNTFEAGSAEFLKGKRRLARKLRRAAGLAVNKSQKEYLNSLIPVAKREKLSSGSLPWGKKSINEYDIFLFNTGKENKTFPVVIINESERTESAGKYFFMIKDALDKGLLKKKVKYFPEENIFFASKIKYPPDLNKEVLFYPRNRTGKNKYPRIFILTGKLESKFINKVAPAAKKLYKPKKAGLVNFETFFMNEIFHRISHFLAPVFVKVKDEEPVTADKKLKELFFTMEEVRAGLNSLINILILEEKGYFKENIFERSLATYLAGIFAELGPGTIKNIPALIQVNYFLDEGGISVNIVKNRLKVDKEKLKKNIKHLYKLVSDLESKGLYEDCRKFIAKYSEINDSSEALINIF